MDLNKTVKITNAKQFEKMVELLEQKPNVARGFNAGLSKINIKEEWNGIAAKINSLGPPIRTGEGWMKVWADYKFKLKKKLTHNKNECLATGGGSYKQYVLSATEQAASMLLQLDTIFNSRPAIGIKSRNTQEILAEIEVVHDKKNEEPCSFNSIEHLSNVGYMSPKELPSLKRAPSKTAETKTKLLSEQLSVQTNLYTDVKKSLAEIESYQRKSFKLKEEKLTLFKQELINKEKYRNEFLKLRMAEIEIKKKRLELDHMKNRLN